VEAALPDIPAGNANTQITPEAAKTLLMKCYLNRGAYKNRLSPSFDDADMQKVITLGNEIIASGKYSYEANYFTNFGYQNKSSKEGIFIYPSSSGKTTNNPGMNARWMMTFHYNEYSAQAPNAGWNGFSTTSDFYKTFGGNGLGTTPNYSLNDTLLDTRMGRRVTSDITTTQASGIRPGFLIGQQYDKAGVPEKDRKGNPLSFEADISPDMIETGSNLEVAGFRVAKYYPDFSDPSGTYYSSNSGNSLMLMRYPDVVLMVAEALLRQGTPDQATALTLVNGLRTARGAAPMVAPLKLNGALTTDANCLLAERGRELYWESSRRTDLIRFNLFLTPWQYKPNDDPKYIVFPVPNQALAVNPNLKQNPGY
jgi:hypothetical protein